jgi:hypothetical protein
MAASAAFVVKKQVHYPHFVFQADSGMDSSRILLIILMFFASQANAQDSNGFDTGGSYQNLGADTYAPGGATYQQSGNTIQSDTGTSYQTEGGLTLGTDGSEYQSYGNTTYNFDGTSCLNSGSATNCD